MCTKYRNINAKALKNHDIKYVAVTSNILIIGIEKIEDK